ncbi:hypothetical protein F4779DRAFT_579471 [Xylariaceae sp. FL0662B]|nr:hypothetical protein F4779DRAFT_579471 [Xylariaceae sp. FL0662B]
MSKRTTFTTISPLPPGITREAVVEFLHNHEDIIDLNPLVIERHPITPPAHAAAEEKRCIWWSMTDKISYLPGGVVTGEITYTAAFNNLPNGVQTHCYAPMGTDIRERWSLNGTLPGEPPQPVELGIGAPRQGLYLREDVELRCNFMMSAFVKKTLKKAHGTLVERLAQKAQLAAALGNKGNRHPAATTGASRIPGDAASGSENSSRNGLAGPPSNHSRSASPYQPQLHSRPQSGPYGHQGYPPAAAATDGSARLGDPAMPAPLRLRSSSPAASNSSGGGGGGQHANGGPLSELRQGQYPQQSQHPHAQNGWANGKAGHGYVYDPQPPRVGNSGFAAELE